MREFNKLAIALLVLGAAGCGGGGGGGGDNASVTPAGGQDAFVSAIGVVIDTATSDTSEGQDIGALVATQDDTSEPQPVTVN